MDLSIDCLLPPDNEFQKLDLLLSQGSFELINYQPDQKVQDLKLVYLMNDAVESFLVFQGARLTGEYLPDFDGNLSASLSEDKHGYVLVLHQDSTVCTLFFQNLTLETHLFDYGKTGHFWVTGYEYLRQLEYRIAILHDKLEYLGTDYCNEAEQQLAVLAAFPPLNCNCYPAVPDNYLVPKYPRWFVSQAAITVMYRLALEAGDSALVRWLDLYQRFPIRSLARHIARMLHQTAHAGMIDLLTEKLADAASAYPERIFSESMQAQIRELYQQAEKRQTELLSQGIQSDILKEEPFQYTEDTLIYKVHLMIWKKKGKSRIVEIETFTSENADKLSVPV